MAKIAGKKGLPFGVLALLAIAYIAFGDAFLPGKFGYYSYYARYRMNEILINIFPSWKQTSPHKRTEDAIRRQEEGR